MTDSKTHIFSDLSEKFDISARTIRYYEGKCLITPHRTTGNQRRHSTRDRQRLKWIMRGKRFGYSLSEISKMLSMVNAKSNAIDQIKMALNYGEQKLADIESRIEELQCMAQGDERVEGDASASPSISDMRRVNRFTWLAHEKPYALIDDYRT